MMTKDLYVAIAASMNNQHDEAIQKLLAILDTNKTSWWAWFYLGVSYNKTQRADDARYIFNLITTDSKDEVVITHAQKALTAMANQQQAAQQKARASA